MVLSKIKFSDGDSAPGPLTTGLGGRSAETGSPE